MPSDWLSVHKMGDWNGAATELESLADAYEATHGRPIGHEDRVSAILGEVVGVLACTERRDGKSREWSLRPASGRSISESVLLDAARESLRAVRDVDAGRPRLELAALLRSIVAGLRACGVVLPAAPVNLAAVAAAGASLPAGLTACELDIWHAVRTANGHGETPSQCAIARALLLARCNLRRPLESLIRRGILVHFGKGRGYAIREFAELSGRQGPRPKRAQNAP